MENRTERVSLSSISRFATRLAIIGVGIYTVYHGFTEAATFNQAVNSINIVADNYCSTLINSAQSLGLQVTEEFGPSCIKEFLRSNDVERDPFNRIINYVEMVGGSLVVFYIGVKLLSELPVLTRLRGRLRLSGRRG